jgi:phenylpropionate dioxygenase-like ring-hydroxylating dioxygenase large terminal subunit
MFHGWAFKLDGTLSGVPGERQFHEFDKADHGMVPAHVDTWAGFVFIHLGERPDETLAEYVGEMGEDISGFPFARMSHSYTYKTKIKTNWKLGVDAFQEYYHTGFIHKASVAKTVNGPGNAVSSLLLTKLYDRHRLLSGWGNPLYRPTAMEMASFQAGMSMANMLTVDDGIAQEFPPNLNPTQHPQWSFDLNVFFPNFILFRFTNLTFTHEFWPSAHDECEWILTLSFPEPRNAGELFSRQQTSITGRDGSLEDLFTLEETFAGLQSGAISEMTLQDNEMSIRHSSKVVEDYVGYYR